MSYTPTEWTSGDVITAEKLNKIENGVAESGGDDIDLNPVIVTYSQPSGWECDYTLSELAAFIESGKTLIAKYYDESSPTACFLPLDSFYNNGSGMYQARFSLMSMNKDNSSSTALLSETVITHYNMGGNENLISFGTTHARVALTS